MKLVSLSLCFFDAWAHAGMSDRGWSAHSSRCLLYLPQTLIHHTWTNKKVFLLLTRTHSLGTACLLYLPIHLTYPYALFVEYVKNARSSYPFVIIGWSGLIWPCGPCRPGPMCGTTRGGQYKKYVCCEEHFEIHPKVCEIQNRSSHLNRKALYV